MESKTGKILTMASSNRFDPENIRKEDIGSLNVNAVEYQFEPGSVIKPLSISLAYDKGLIKRNETFSAYNMGGSANGAGKRVLGKSLQRIVSGTERGAAGCRTATIGTKTTNSHNKSHFRSREYAIGFGRHEGL
jgi:cell division protein FtsI/penicillin-binding protein 2